MSVKIAIIGAGPYGLSVASALGADQAEVVLLGEPMKTWRTAMPEGMSLKSDGFASKSVLAREWGDPGGLLPQPAYRI